MKISLNDLRSRIKSDFNINDVSDLLTQLGHENEFSEKIIDIDITPNRGDCLSLLGILRDLKNFYDVDDEFDIYNGELEEFDLNFVNAAKSECPSILFLKIEIDEEIKAYSSYLNNYFEDLEVKKINFFTDISNYLMYEIGQPTHCYDAKKLKGKIELKKINNNTSFRTLTDKEIKLRKNDLVFTDDDKVINLAGIMGGENTACDKDSREVIIECAYFEPEAIIGKSLKYDLNSDAAFRFERGIDRNIQEKALRRFLKIVSDHAHIKSVQIFMREEKNKKNIMIPLEKEKIEKILGINLNMKDFSSKLEKLSFNVSNKIEVPSFRHDISSNNDIAEELARVIGYDSFPRKQISIQNSFENSSGRIENIIRAFLRKNNFNEVINFPFTSVDDEYSFKIDNPIDSNKSFFRISARESMINNLGFNERRQKDSIRLFEISEYYSILDDKLKSEKKLSLIASGRVGENFKEFNKFIDEKFMLNILKKIFDDEFICGGEISRESIDSKSKTKVFFYEINLRNVKDEFKKSFNKIDIPFPKKMYIQPSDFPSIYRDISFMLKDKKDIDIFLREIESLDLSDLKKSFIFDFFENKKQGNFKIGIRFVFQSNSRTLTDIEIKKQYNKIIESALRINGVSIPGL